MHPDFWLERWRTGQIGFHQKTVNPLLQTHWDALGVRPDASVFVPLCGKSLDMLWLRAQGHPVLGVDLSRDAVEAFFREAAVTPSVSARGVLPAFEAAGWTLLVGDFFDVSSENLAHVGGVYDRAALIALPPDMRQKYVQTLTERLPHDVSILLVTFEYDQARTQGPPFAVLEDEVRRLYEGPFRVELLERVIASDLAERFKNLGVGAIHEAAYAIRR